MATTDKEWERERPFVRINSPSEAPTGPPPRGVRLNGDGHARGNRRQSDFDPVRSVLEELVISRLIALTPSWTTTLGTISGNDIALKEKEAEEEVFGKLQRSFQTWTDAPPLPWHTWYDWNFHIEPEKNFQWLRGRGNNDSPKEADPVAARAPLPPTTDARERLIAIEQRELAKQEAVVKGRSMELEWDTGGFGIKPGAMFNSGGITNVDWAWPMADDFLWAVGRSIYDGGHEEEIRELSEEDPAVFELPLIGIIIEKLRDLIKKRQPGDRVTRSELHPCKAIATARWEGHRFPGTEFFVPAVQFMFYSSKLGGYKGFDSLAPKEDNFEFIVDLPPTAGAFNPITASIGHTPDFPFNRLVLRQEPLLDFEFDRFRTSLGRTPGGRFENFQRFKPKVKLLPAKDDPLKRQVKVTMPMKEFAEAFDDADFYGVVLSMGWPDPKNQHARKVKKCTVRLIELFKAEIDHDTFKEEWRFKVGVNGRWFQFEFGKVGNNKVLPLNKEIVMHLHEDDLIRVSAHGAELDLVDDVYFDSDRQITLSQRDINRERDPSQNSGSTTQRDIVWDEHVAISPREGDAFIDGSQPAQRAICHKLFSLMASTFNDQNDPLGIIDAGRGNADEKAFNPIRIADFIEQFGERAPGADSGGFRQFELLGLHTSEVGDSAELVQVAPDLAESKDIDYRLRYSITVEAQDIPEGS